MTQKISNSLQSFIEHQIIIWDDKKIVRKYPQVQNSRFNDLERGLSILKISKDYFGIPWMHAKEISALLIEVFNLPSDPIGITRAFAKAGGRDKSKKPVLIKKCDNAVLYKISHSGEIFLDSIWGKGLLKILYVAPNSHSCAYESLKDLVTKLKGKELNIVDPYYGVSSFNVIEEILRAGKNVKFLSFQTNETTTTIKREISYLKKHYPKKIEFRIYSKKELHDRYILAAGSFVIIGQGLKDLGNKESLILVINDRLGSDIRKELDKSFWQRWNDTSTISL